MQSFSHAVPFQFTGIAVTNDVTNPPEWFHFLRKLIVEKYRERFSRRCPKSTEELNVPVFPFWHIEPVIPDGSLENILDAHVDRPKKLSSRSLLPKRRISFSHVFVERCKLLNDPIDLVQFDANLSLQLLRTSGF